MDTIINIFKRDLHQINNELKINSKPIVEIKNIDNCHYTTAIALASAKQLNINPRQLAEQFQEKLLATNNYEKVQIAGPGFINVLVKNTFLTKVLNNINVSKENYGSSPKKHKIMNIEYVSANPTGNLHIGHGRNAVMGSSLAKIYAKAGWTVQTEYYINDAGNQINVAAISTFVHYLWLNGKTEVTKPENSYGGEMYDNLAKHLKDKYASKFVNNTFTGVYIDDEKVHALFKKEATEYFLNSIKNELLAFGCEFDHWSSEQSMYDNHEIEKTLQEYANLNSTYKEGGALWLQTTKFGDDKDRVLIKSNGEYTYILPDLACHNERIRRTKANKLINVWGGDHHGYLARMKAGLALLGNNSDILQIEFVQMVRLIKDGAEFKMSKRKGTAVWLSDIVEMLGVDVTRYMLVSKASNSHMDLDMDILMQKNASNPIFYAQYMMARCNSIISQANEKNIKPNFNINELLTNIKEQTLLVLLDSFNDVIESATSKNSAHLIAEYIQSVAKEFHSYYSETKIIDNNKEISSAKVALIHCILQTMKNAFELIGITPNEKM